MEKKALLKLLLQPLVENALYHGIKNKRGKGLITVHGWIEAHKEWEMTDWLCFSVEDDGIGMTAEQLAALKNQTEIQDDLSLSPSQSYGLYNVGKRLELYYNQTGLLEIQSVYKEGTKVTLRIPAVDNV
jgi:two-component system sensor histidine kinase YesM